MAVTDYMMTTGKSAKWSKAEVSMDGKTVTVTLTDDDYNPVETYTIDPYTGKGVTASGASVDLPQTCNAAAQRHRSVQLHPAQAQNLNAQPSDSEKQENPLRVFTLPACLP